MPDSADPLNLEGIVEAVYDSVGDGSLWPEALNRICVAFDAVLGILAVADTAVGRARFRATFGMRRCWRP